MTATSRGEPCATILLQAALAPSSRRLLPMGGADPRHLSQLCTSQDTRLELYVRGPVQQVLGTSLHRDSASVAGTSIFLAPWAELEFFFIPLG